jgi:hypothetical protein
MNPLKQNFTRLLIGLFGVMFLLYVLSTVLANSLQAAEADAVPMPVSINALMVTLIDHSAHYLWDYGVMQRDMTDEEWRTVEYYAIQLAAAGPLIMLGGTGPMDDAWVESPDWLVHTRNMTSAATLALDAAQRKDKGLLLSLGDALTASCEGCHDHFKPDLPSEGFNHIPDYDYLYHLFR